MDNKKNKTIEESYTFIIHMLIISVLFTISSSIVYNFTKMLLSKYTITALTLITIFVIYLLSLVYSKKILSNHKFWNLLGFPIIIALILVYFNKGFSSFLSKEYGLFVILIFVWFFVYIWHFYKNPIDKINYKLIYIIIISLSIFIIGAYFILGSSLSENTHLGLLVNSCGSDKIFGAELECSGPREYLFVDSQVNCNLVGLEYDSFAGNLTIYFFNGSTIDIQGDDKYSFIIPKDVSRIGFTTYATTNNTTKCFSSISDFSFTTYEQVKKQIRDMWLYMVSLMGFILLTIPMIIKEWGKIING